MVETTASQDLVYGALQTTVRIEEINSVGVVGALENTVARDVQAAQYARQTAQMQQQVQANITAEINATGQRLIQQSNISLKSIAEQNQPPVGASI